MTPELVIFDLDGTILDTLSDLLGAMNAALADSGYPGHTMSEMRGFIGNGLRMMAVRAVPEGTPEAGVAKVYNFFKSYYAEHLNINTAPYPGIMQLISDLRGRGIHTAVSTNKIDYGAKKLIKEHFGELIEYTLGETEGTPRKPDPAGPARIAAFFGVKPENCVYVGDSSVDIETARNFGCACVAVSWGFQDETRLISAGAERIAHNADELARYLYE